jgi:hypothetical protein
MIALNCGYYANWEFFLSYGEKSIRINLLNADLIVQTVYINCEEPLYLIVSLSLLTVMWPKRGHAALVLLDLFRD